MKLPIKVKPYEHQVKAFNFAEEKLTDYSGIALLMDMGLGKSLTSIAIIGDKYLKSKIEKVLVICPTSIINVWEEEFKKFADYDYSLESIVGSTMSKRKEKLKLLNYKKGLKVAVINYEATWRMEQELKDYDPDMIICDESQKIKTYNASQSKAIHRLGSRAKYRIILTGTPVQNKDKDTTAIFGDIIDTYDMTQAIMDGSTVPIMYESRMARVGLNQKILDDIDDYYNMLETEEGIEDYKIAESKKAMATMKQIIEDPDRLEMIVKDIIKHYEDMCFDNGAVYAKVKEWFLEKYPRR